MKSYDILLMANKNLWRRKGRTVLTVLGVIIGTASIVVMVSLGIGLVETEKRNMSQWGSLNIVNVHQAYSYPGMPEEEQKKKLTDEAIAEIREIEGVIAVSPAFETWGEVRWGKKIGHIQLVGIEPDLMEMLEFSVSDGRLLNADDRFNVVAGAQVINNFWDEKARYSYPMERQENDPSKLLNQRLMMTVHNMRQPPQKRIYNLNVVGILDQKHTDKWYSVYGPISEIKKIRDFMNQGRQDQQHEFYYDAPAKTPVRVTPRSNQKEEEQYNFAIVKAKDVTHARRISKMLREDLGYFAHSMADSLEGIERTARIIQAVLGGIGAITLLVAAIGITNTMVMSIYERMREIAIMKVIGASFGDIRWLFLAESSIIGLMGGTLGLGLSYLLSYVLNQYGQAFINQGMHMMGPGGPVHISLIPPWLAVFALFFSISIGLLAGVYPANRAIRLDPITAMRQ